MTFQFRPAKRENVGLLIGVAGPSGSGKTMSAFRVASGICGDAPFAVIDTESRRALHYADRFRFDHAELREPFTPRAYTEAIVAADKAGYPVIVVDSASHEYAGDGGVLDMAESELNRMAGDDWKKREACRMASWIKPKTEHKHMVSKLLQVRAHLILCFRADQKIEMVKDPQTGKLVIQQKHTLTGLDGYVPITEKNLPYELTVSFLLLPSNPGVGLPIKLQEQHKSIFPSGTLIDEECGRRIAQWAAGGAVARPAAQTPAPVAEEPAARTDAVAKLERAAQSGLDALLKEWQSLTQPERDECGGEFGRIKRSIQKRGAA